MGLGHIHSGVGLLGVGGFPLKLAVSQREEQCHCECLCNMHDTFDMCKESCGPNRCGCTCSNCTKHCWKLLSKIDVLAVVAAFVCIGNWLNMLKSQVAGVSLMLKQLDHLDHVDNRTFRARGVVLQTRDGNMCTLNLLCSFPAQ